MMRWLVAILMLLTCCPVQAGRNDLIALEATVMSVVGRTIALSNVTGLAVGDVLIIESQHGYNEPGLNGSWKIVNLPIDDKYFTGASKVGKSFIATVTVIDGNRVTVTHPVPPAARWLTCYRDNSQAIKWAIENRIEWPAGQRFAYATADAFPLMIYLTDEWHDYDFRGCEIFAPRGCGALTLGLSRVGGGPANNKRLRNLTLRGNVRDSGYGFVIYPGDKYVQGASMPAAWTIGGVTAVQARNIVIEHFTFIDNWRDVSVDHADECLVTDCQSTFTDPLRQYIQWCYLASHSNRCRFQRCAVTDKLGMRAGFEAFQSDEIEVVDCGGENTGFSSNSSNRTRLLRCSTTITVENPNAAWSQFTPIVNLNVNIANQQGALPESVGIVIKDFRVDYAALPYPAGKTIFNTILVAPKVEAAIDGVVLSLPLGETAVSPVHTGAGYLVGSNSATVTTKRLVGHSAVLGPLFTINYVPQPGIL